jgi:Na+-driven multidrug efflux pump
MNDILISVCILTALVVGLRAGADHPDEARKLSVIAAIVAIIFVGVLIGGAA